MKTIISGEIVSERPSKGSNGGLIMGTSGVPRVGPSNRYGRSSVG